MTFYFENYLPIPYVMFIKFLSAITFASCSEIDQRVLPHYTKRRQVPFDHYRPSQSYLGVDDSTVKHPTSISETTIFFIEDETANKIPQPTSSIVVEIEYESNDDACSQYSAIKDIEEQAGNGVYKSERQEYTLSYYDECPVTTRFHSSVHHSSTREGENTDVLSQMEEGVSRTDRRQAFCETAQK